MILMTKKDAGVTVKLNVGDIVTWTSQANGSSITKKGTVVEVIPAGKQPSVDVIRTPGAARKHESYVVDVVQVSNGRARKPKRYWPLVSLLKPLVVRLGQQQTDPVVGDVHAL